ncbi:MAG: glycosyltransferase [Candidatus ainarchaeum sp.]|nr:glycosyltransferase [Candidatus ainarchaeum sp.]
MKTKIFVTVGSTYPLNRLINEIDKLSSKEFEVFAQIGESELKPKNIKYSRILKQKKIIEKIKWCDIVISHAGVGTIIEVLNQNKKLILFPRLKKFGEAIDDHQTEICKAFGKKYEIKWTTNEKKIEKLLKNIKKIKVKKENKLVREIEKII